MAGRACVCVVTHFDQLLLQNFQYQTTQKQPAITTDNHEDYDNMQHLYMITYRDTLNL